MKDGGRMAEERVCRHCGARYRGLACPCRRRAAAERRAREHEGAKAMQASLAKDAKREDREEDGSGGADGLSVADGKG